jgi:hypothetical protein
MPQLTENKQNDPVVLANFEPNRIATKSGQKTKIKIREHCAGNAAQKIEIQTRRHCALREGTQGESLRDSQKVRFKDEELARMVPKSPQNNFLNFLKPRRNSSV